MLDIQKFDWGWMDEPVKIELGITKFHTKPDGSIETIPQYHKRCITQEIFQDRLYEKFFEVESGDLVIDVGASLGPFTYSILHKAPKHVYCFEPSIKEFRTLNKNVRGYPVTTINKGISNVNSVVQ